MREFWESVQYSAFGMWIAGGEGVLGWPTILALHTVGLGVVVGSNAVLDLRLLGFGKRVPLAELKGVFRTMWMGFSLNAATGLLLFIAAAADKAYQKIFYLKLFLIFLALLTATRIKHVVYDDPATAAGPVPQKAKTLAILSLFLWMGAIVAGRLMAYVTTF